MSDLTDDQIDLLAHMLIEECGGDLTDDQFAEQAAMLLEDVAGFEIVSDDELLPIINRVRSAYYVASQH